MARLPRLTVTGLPHHVVLRGHNQQPIFVDDHDRCDWLALLADYAPREQVHLHAYVLLDNHIHLLLTPQQDGALSRLMQALGRTYVRRFNQRHQRSGTLWEGRYRCTVLDPQHWLLPCMVSLDLSPVRVGLVATPQAYPWSSYAHYIGLRHDKSLTPHAVWWALGNTPFAREAAYAQAVERGIDATQQRALMDAALQGWALGDDAFLAQIGQHTPRRLQKARPGRPPAAAPRT
ncbi:MAG: transposase [Macromonas sp.]